MRASKGSEFEREICKKLSLWWTKGERDDVFWRSSQSGGRATQRLKKGLTTYGSYGDIAAVDPVGEPLLRMFTIELKRGNSHGNPFDLFDALPTKTVRTFEACLIQTIQSHKNANSIGWLLICKRDRRVPMVWTTYVQVSEFLTTSLLPRVRVSAMFNGIGPLPLIGFRLEDFLRTITPNMIKEYLSTR